MEKVTIYCPDCGRIAGHYDGRSTIDHPCRCKKCNQLVIYRVATGKIETKQTNADRIRNMSDEELADYLATVTSDTICGSSWDYDGWIKELQSEAE